MRPGIPLQCHYCQRPGLTRDHVMPRAWGGLDEPWNVVPACRSCNESKRADAPTCRCDFCREAVRRYASGERGTVSRVKRSIVRRRGGVWRVTRRGGGATLVTFRTLKAAHSHATALCAP